MCGMKFIESLFLALALVDVDTAVDGSEIEDP